MLDMSSSSNRSIRGNAAHILTFFVILFPDHSTEVVEWYADTIRKAASGEWSTVIDSKRLTLVNLDVVGIVTLSVEPESLEGQ